VDDVCDLEEPLLEVGKREGLLSNIVGAEVTGKSWSMSAVLLRGFSLNE
jgi:hypothetical protein